jgi:hypothetical protein
MGNVLEERGLFWWFEESIRPAHSKETSLPGLLTITDDGLVTLNVDGALCGKDEGRGWTEPRTFPASRGIAGQLASPGEYVLLEGLERIDLSVSDESPQRQEFTAQQCTRRDSPFPDSYGQGEFLELRVEMTGLEDWLELDSILVGAEDTDNDAVQVRVSYKNHRLNFPTLGGTISIVSFTTGADLFNFFRHIPEGTFSLSKRTTWSLGPMCRVTFPLCVTFAPN